ncbi:MAG: hypothetical protein IKV63_00630 [Clostridia bacterium]|nr:hypothetical protein [Clostridia bacterium]
MLLHGTPVDPLAIMLYGSEVVIEKNDTFYYYAADSETDYFSPLYFIPVRVATTFGGEIVDSVIFPRSEFDDKYYISPFTDEHIVRRHGFSHSLMTLYKTEKAVE